jgi:hypothetical protein
MQMDAHSHVQGADDPGCVISAELMRSLAERARASRFRRYLDRALDDSALTVAPKQPTLTAPPLTPVVRVGM